MEQINLGDIKEEDYIDKWVESVNDKGEIVHENDVLGMKITIHSITEHGIDSTDVTQTDQF